ncbi:MAG: non-homologous end-joining DNA ligase, partial [Ginsengibacter sp.]
HLRSDKNKKDVSMANTKEVAAPKEHTTVPKKTAKKKAVDQQKSENDATVRFGKYSLKLSNLDKIYFPEDGITKGDVINYYKSIGSYLLPYLKGRPESLLRHPNGIHEQGFFHKDAAENAPGFVENQKVHSESNDKYIDYIVCNNQATLTYMNNLGCIEINPWHSTTASLEKPDYLIIDIDPSDKNTFEQVIESAIVLKEILDKAGAPAFCKTSGASGMHIYVPTGKKYTYEQVKDFTHLVCMLANEQLKAFTTLERNLKKRGNKHIYLDYLQNRKGQTISSVYSLRPKTGGTVSTPLEWKEVKTGLSPKDFTIKNSLERIKKKGDLFKGVMGKGIDLKKCLNNLGQYRNK